MLQLKVDEVIFRMGLRKVADCRIGGHIERGISGGERRRVSIATQLVHEPSNPIKCYQIIKNISLNSMMDQLYLPYVK